VCGGVGVYVLVRVHVFVSVNAVGRGHVWLLVWLVYVYVPQTFLAAVAVGVCMQERGLL